MQCFADIALYRYAVTLDFCYSVLILSSNFYFGLFSSFVYVKMCISRNRLMIAMVLCKKEF